MFESFVEPRAEAPHLPSDARPGHVMPTRFGAVAVDEARIVRLPHGLFGFPQRTLFMLTELPDRESPFKLLQSVEDPELGLLVLPLDADGGMIRHRHLERAAIQAGIGIDDLVALAVVTLRAGPGDVRCTVNLKAPILIDSEKRLGIQHVLASDDYDVRHPLPLNDRSA
jgi:flagellar assembly factor FliW